MTLGLDLDFGRLPALERRERWPGTPREDAGVERAPEANGGAEGVFGGAGEHERFR